MWFQWFRKGVNGLSDDQATKVLHEVGLMCRWWQQVGIISTSEIASKLNQQALRLHLDKYDIVKDDTPFISLTAGVRMRRAKPRGHGSNRVIGAERIAVQYATNRFDSPGHIFAGWVPVLPHSAVELEGFAEDVRDLLTYSRFRQFHNQGEVTAKVHVPMSQLQWVDRVDVPAPGSGASATSAVRTRLADNPRFVVPAGHAAIRDVL